MNEIPQLAHNTHTHSGKNKINMTGNLPFIATAKGFSSVTCERCFCNINITHNHIGVYMTVLNFINTLQSGNKSIRGRPRQGTFVIK